MLSLLALVAAQASPPPLVRTNPTAPPPIITYGPPKNDWRWSDWVVSNDPEITIGLTKNTSESSFGMVCLEDCSWFVDFNLECQEDTTYPAMVAAGGVVYPLKLECLIVGDSYLLIYNVTAMPMAAVSGQGQLAFVIGNKDGSFNVSRFSLAGAPPALAKTMTLAVERGKRKQSRPKDYKL